MIEIVLVGGEDHVAEPLVAHELPDSLDQVEFGRMGRQRHQGDVSGDHEVAGDVPARAIEDQHSVRPRINGAADLGEMLVHCRGVATGHDQAGPLALLGADRAEDVGGGGTLVLGRGGAAVKQR